MKCPVSIYDPSEAAEVDKWINRLTDSKIISSNLKSESGCADYQSRSRRLSEVASEAKQQLRPWPIKVEVGRKKRAVLPVCSLQRQTGELWPLIWKEHREKKLTFSRAYRKNTNWNTSKPLVDDVAWPPPSQFTSRWCNVLCFCLTTMHLGSLKKH